MPSYPREGKQQFLPLRQERHKERAIGATVTECQQALIHTVSLAVTAGAAIMFGATSDGGAMVITLFAGAERRRDYATDRESMLEVLLAVDDVCEAYMMQGSKTPPNGSQGSFTRT